ncbi:MAG: hypothetical protein IPH37_14670 [Burkholderiales bacterium]|nr:hypothetical protein [Burkholderiales bacterium]
MATQSDNLALSGADGPELPASRAASWRFFLLSYAYLATLGFVSSQTASLDTLEFGIGVLVLAVPMMLALCTKTRCIA